MTLCVFNLPEKEYIQQIWNIVSPPSNSRGHQETFANVPPAEKYLCGKNKMSWTKRSLCVPAASLSHLWRISHEGSCPGNGTGVNQLAQVPGSKVDGRVSSNHVAVWYLWPLTKPDIIMKEEYTLAINQCYISLL